MPRTVTQSVSIDALNTLTLYPSSDGEKLSPGVLQVSPSTTLLLDETELAEGQLGDTGKELALSL